MSNADSHHGHLIGLPNLLTTQEAATILRVNPSWLERQAASRKIPFSMLGGCYRFTTEHLRRIVEIFESVPQRRTEKVPAEVRAPRARQLAAQTPSTVTPLRARPRRQARPQNAAA